jgi:uncharacterized protein with beta-barrel porin domain
MTARPRYPALPPISAPFAASAGSRAARPHVGLRGGVSRVALILTMPSLIALGIALPAPARADVTISTPQTTQQNLDVLPNGPPATDIATVTSVGSVDVTALPSTDAIVGSARNWTLTNQGVVSGSDSGVNLNSAGGNTVINAGSITGVAASGIYLQQGGRVLNQGGAAITGYSSGVSIQTGIGSVLNQGTITAYGCGCSGGAGVSIGVAGGSVVNQGIASRIVGNYGVSIGGVGTVTNEGTIQGGVLGVYLKSGGTVTNLGTASYIGGLSAGVYLHSTGIIVNQGTITTLAGYAIQAKGNATITNQGTTSLIAGAVGGITGYLGTTSTVTNQGTISSGGGNAIALGAGSVFNQGAASTITADGGHGVFFGDGPGTVTNDGRITASVCGCLSPADGVYLTVGGSVTNNAGALIQGYGAGVLVASQLGTIINAGTIIATAGSPSYGVSLAVGGSVTNAAGGLISGDTSGIFVQGLAGTIGNSGTITGTAGVGINLQAGGIVTNQAGGVITGATNGITVAGGAGTINNSATITGTGGIGVNLQAGGTVTNQAGGVITGATAGIAVAGAAGTITNAGRITSGAGPAITFTGAFDSALTNSGTLTNGSGTTAVLFGAGNDTLTLQTGSRLGGDADGGAGSNTLVLQGSGTETHNFLNFQSIKMSGSSWLLTGTLTSNLTVVELGRLAINGTLISPVIVTNTGTLGGNGTIIGSVTNNGTIAPGNSIGTTTINGSYVQAAGSHYQVELDATGASDKIAVTGAPGTATLNGGTVDIVRAAGSYGKTTSYRILSATGGVTGAFAGTSFATTSPFFSAALSYDPNDAFMTLTRSFAGFDLGLTPNQRAVGTALDQAGSSPNADIQNALDALEGLTAAQAPNALDQLGGEAYSSFATVQLRGAQLFANLVGQQMAQTHGGAGGSLLAQAGTRVQLASLDPFAEYLAQTTPDAPQRARPWSAWASGYGVSGGVAGDGNAHDLGYTLGGTAFGLDYRVAPDLVVGGAFGYMRSDATLSGLSGRATANIYQGAAYASYAPGRFYLDGLLGYAHGNETVTRSIAFTGLSRNATGETSANQFLAALETGFANRLDGTTVLTPYAGLQASTAIQDSFVESGAGGLDLAVAGQTTSSLRSILGGKLAKTVETSWERPLALELRVGWAHEFVNDDRAVTASFVGVPGAAFTVQGAKPGRDSALIGLAAQTALNDQSSIFLRYDGDINGADNAHAITGGIRITW